MAKWRCLQHYLPRENTPALWRNEKTRKAVTPDKISVLDNNMRSLQVCTEVRRDDAIKIVSP